MVAPKSSSSPSSYFEEYQKLCIALERSDSNASQSTQSQPKMAETNNQPEMAEVKNENEMGVSQNQNEMVDSQNQNEMGESQNQRNVAEHESSVRQHLSNLLSNIDNDTQTGGRFNLAPIDVARSRYGPFSSTGLESLPPTPPVSATFTNMSGGPSTAVSGPITPTFTEGRSSTDDSANTTPGNSNSGNNHDVHVPISQAHNPYTIVNGMPYTLDRLADMGQALAQARRNRLFPPTITPGYNVRATIEDFEDLERLRSLRGDGEDSGNDAFRPDVARLYTQIQRRIQDRDLTYGEIAAETNVRARIEGFANATRSEASMYNLMRHAVNSVLRHNNLTVDGDGTLVEAVASRVVDEIRATVQGQAATGANGVTEQNMSAVLDEVFQTIGNALSQEVGTQADRLDGQLNNMTGITNDMTGITNNMSNVTDAAHDQVNAIAGHVNAIDNHVHAMGNNVGAMSSLLNSTNGNVASLGTSINVLQTVINALPQLVTVAIQQMIPEIIGTAVQDSITDEIVAQLISLSARQNAQAPRRTTRSRVRAWLSKFNVFKKSRDNRHGRK